VTVAPAAVIFDCDGTLVDSEPLSRRAWERSLAPYGYQVTDEDLRACVGRSYPHTHGHFAARAPLPGAEAFWPLYSRELFALIDAELVPFADAVGAAVELRRRGVPLAVASSSARERLERTLVRGGLSEIFGVTVAGDEVARGKPAPDMFLAAAQRLGVEPSGCIAVEDSVPGVQSALAAGMVAVAVARESPRPAGLGAAHLLVAELSADVLLGSARR
jgi:HAD superfamily hydrolase (TIGR01509 family)